MPSEVHISPTSCEHAIHYDAEHHHLASQRQRFFRHDNQTTAPFAAPRCRELTTQQLPVRKLQRHLSSMKSGVDNISALLGVIFKQRNALFIDIVLYFDNSLLFGKKIK